MSRRRRGSTRVREWEPEDQKPCGAAAPAQCMSRALWTLRPDMRCRRCRRLTRLLLCCILRSADVAPVDAVAPLVSAEVDADRAELCASIRVCTTLADGVSAFTDS